MKLFGTPGSPYVRKVRIVLAEKNIPYDYIVARASTPDSPVPAFNPLAKIPTLVRDDGRALYDSPVIVEYLDAFGSGPKLIPEDFESRIEVKRWEALGDGIAEATVNINHEYREPADKQRSAEWFTKQQLKIDRGLALMEKDLGNRRILLRRPLHPRRHRRRLRAGLPRPRAAGCRVAQQTPGAGKARRAAGEAPLIHRQRPHSTPLATGIIWT